MKVFVIVALFAFVALQFSHAVPIPEDEKKEEPAPVMAAANPVAPETSAPSATVAAAEVKSEASKPEVSVSPTAGTPAAAPAAEVKKP